MQPDPNGELTRTVSIMRHRDPFAGGKPCRALALLGALLLFAHATPSPASIAYVGSAAPALSSSGVVSVTITAPAGLATGDVMIAYVAQNTGGLPAVSAAPTGWTAVLERDDGSSIGGSVYYRVATSADVAGTTTYTWTFQQSEPSGGLILAFSGVSTTAPVVTSASQVNANSGTYTAPSVTPGMANTELVVLFAADDGNGGINSPAGTARAYVGGTGAGPNGIVIGAFTEALTASTATGQLQSSTNTAAVNIGATLALQPGSGAGTPDHFAISDAGTAVNCQASPVTIMAHSLTHAPVATTGTITVSTSTGHGDWSPTSGGGSFIAGASNSGTANYTYVTADNGAVTLSLRDTYAETVTINVADGPITQKSGSAIASEQQPLTFVASGFRFTNGANAATSIGTQVAGKSSTQSLALQAVRTDTNTGACTAAFPSGQTVSISLAYQCNNPATCVAGQTLGITNNAATTNIASNPASGVTTYTPVLLKFSTVNAEAPFSLDYSDVGQITLFARYTIPLGSGLGSGSTMNGGGQFVVQPYNFTLSNIKCTTYGAGTCAASLPSPGNNPGASSAAGAAFIQAGQPFSATVTATNFMGAATPNYGLEISPPGVTLTANLMAPAGGDAAALNNAAAFGTFSGGVATGTTFNWPEVGVISLTPGVANYLGSGTVTGTASGNVGRFIPNGFAVALNTPVFGTGCSAGAFSYVGQPLLYTVAPVMTVTAQAVGGTTTRNYTGAFLKLTNASLNGRTYTPTPASPALNVSGLPPTSSDPAVADLGTGQASLTFSAGSGLLFSRGAAIAPFSANVALSLNVADADGVSAPNPVTFGTGTGISFSTAATQYYGRLALLDAVGSELLDLPMLLTTQYYMSTTQGFAANAADSCTVAPAISFSNYQLNLAAGQTCVRDSGSPGISGAGCAAAAASRYLPIAWAGPPTPPPLGSFNLILAAPGAGHAGAVSVTATAPAWLQYNWGGSSNPLGMATFGVFPGPASRVHQREVY
jgi:MSHA biogenesis protein MshQ